MTFASGSYVAGRDIARRVRDVGSVECVCGGGGERECGDKGDVLSGELRVALYDCRFDIFIKPWSRRCCWFERFEASKEYASL
jgi:hypothetical protein